MKNWFKSNSEPLKLKLIAPAAKTLFLNKFLLFNSVIVPPYGLLENRLVLYIVKISNMHSCYRQFL